MNKNKYDNYDLYRSKSHVLEFLHKHLKYSKIEKLFYFQIENWENNRSKVLSEIQKKFSKPIIVRSSAIGEDSINSSGAGLYQSIQNVNPKSKKSVIESIDAVIDSYNKKQNINLQNQVLIQTQSRNIITSGVIFSRTPDVGSPYYVINYEDGNATDGVTKGTVNNSVRIFRNVNLNKLPKKWKFLLHSVKEIEKLLNSEILDIEFGITKSYKIIIFQVRPIVSLKNLSLISENHIEKLILKNKQLFRKKSSSKKLPGKLTIFSDMADWNPAEIIGNNPNALDYSLYNYLIMDSAWHLGRQNIGYQRLRQNLMIKFGNKPYVDVKASFNSLIPNLVSRTMKEKLMNYYLTKLLHNTFLHDKVEFDILFTCNEYLISSRMLELNSYFSSQEIKIFKNILIDFTNKIILDFPKILRNNSIAIKQMRQKHSITLKKLTESQRSYKNLILAAEKLLNDCIIYGTVPFSTIARIAFIASINLKSLVRHGVLTQKLVDDFLNSIETPLSQFQNDQILYISNKITKSSFLKKYGHLRPGTYDITAPRYDSDSFLLDNLKFKTSLYAKNQFIKPQSVLDYLEKDGFTFINIDFFDFAKSAIIERENLKFEFTKNLSDALELISEAGTRLNFSANEISCLDIKIIFSDVKKLNKKQLLSKWRKLIQQQKTQHAMMNNLVLPPIISSEKDFEFITYPLSKPNFITSKKISSKLIFLNNNHEKINLDNKIILLENADPGFDWIFSNNILGLITKYGGVASHMAIRCAELGIPAAIGCGEILYQKLQSASKILLDCDNAQIVILEHSNSDRYVEEKRILKLLGYIK